ncbi:CBS domain-containing protein CBSCBSPB3-like isoform X7 [Triticum dicoccoides]|uniref:CBS domain-containing protein CBSCBSPB3-like isoform X7 n=1 Tax=Triticum dicoccoides TaxID=85692 RepID=UPI00188FDC75|nr:CBS domain-containing protein CBSCBSPB3-like isoform X7 [Triticum dicoccoides]
MEEQIAALVKSVNEGRAANDARLEAIQTSLELWRPAVTNLQHQLDELRTQVGRIALHPALADPVGQEGDPAADPMARSPAAPMTPGGTHHGPEGHGNIIDSGGSAHGVVTTLAPPPVKGPHTLIENLRDHMFKPSLSTIITENSSVPSVSPSDLVTLAAKKMREYRVNSVVVMTGNMLQGILTSKDLVLRVVAQNLSPEVTLVEKVMTASPDCATLDTSILEALQSMHDRKYRHILVADRRGQIVACLDALQLTHTAISMVEGAYGANDVANTLVQKFWDSALALHPAEEYDWHSDESRTAASDSAEGKQTPPHVGNAFSF